MTFEKELLKYAEQPLNRQVLLDLLREYERPNDKLAELVKKGDLIQVKRGLYLPGPKSLVPPPERLLIANHLYGPSYLSLETALAYWQFIPEKTFEIISVTTGFAKQYQTPVGNFRFIHLPTPYYSYGITRVDLSPRQSVLMATAEKALCDKIVTTPGILLRSVRQTKQFLLEDMRMEPDRLRAMDNSKIDSWLKSAPKKDSLKMLTKTLKRL